MFVTGSIIKPKIYRKSLFQNCSKGPSTKYTDFGEFFAPIFSFLIICLTACLMPRPGTTGKEMIKLVFGMELLTIYSLLEAGSEHKVCFRASLRLTNSVGNETQSKEM